MKKFFFERQQEARGELPTTFSYDTFPNSLKNQMGNIWSREQNISYQVESIVLDLRLALGLKKLGDGSYSTVYDEEWSYWKELLSFFYNRKNIDHILTVVDEIGCRLNCNLLNEMNHRMQRAGIGYKHTGKQLMRIEDERFFEEATAPCLSILSREGFSNARKHFMDAYDELKQQKFDDALTDCGQALESIIKTKLSRAKIKHNEHDNLNKLLPILKEHLIAPDFMQDYLNNLFKIIEGLATWRNKEGAHGATEGAKKHVDGTFVRFVINQTATNILFLAEAEFSNA